MVRIKKGNKIENERRENFNYETQEKKKIRGKGSEAITRAYMGRLMITVWEWDGLSQVLCDQTFKLIRNDSFDLI